MKNPGKSGEHLFVWTPSINTAMFPILSLYEFSTFADLKSSFVAMFKFCLIMDCSFLFVAYFFSVSLRQDKLE